MGEGNTASIGFDDYPVKVPSGKQTGEKLVAGALSLFAADGAELSVTIIMDPDHSVLHNRGQGWILKPVIKIHEGIVSTRPFNESVPDQIVVMFAEATSEEEIEEMMQAVGGTEVRRGLIDKLMLVIDVPEGTVDDALAYFRAPERADKMRGASRNYVVRAFELVPNDPGFDLQWGLHSRPSWLPWRSQVGGQVDADIDAPEAWFVTTGDSNVVVAVIDSGIDSRGPDLEPNLWVNPGEDLNGDGVIQPSEINGADDDVPPNDIADDFYGANVVAQNADIYDDVGHGTSVAGVIGAVGDNGTGVAGVAWQVRLMTIKYLTVGGTGTTAAYKDALDYAVSKGAVITNQSFGGYYPFADQFVLEWVFDNAVGASNLLHCIAAGNGSTNIDTDSEYTWPAEMDRPSTIVTAATYPGYKGILGIIDRPEAKKSSSNWGQTSVDLGAPGDYIYTTVRWEDVTFLGGLYGYRNGTSVAAPHVTGVAVLTLAAGKATAGDPASMKDQILGTVDVMDTLSGVVSGGRLNAYRAVTETVSP